MSTNIRGKTTSSRISIKLTVLTLGAGLCMGVHGQKLEEIIVTAQKRSQSLQDVPISMISISGDELRKQGIRSAAEVAQLTPNFEFMSNEGFGVPRVYMRGVGDVNFHANTVGAVGVSVDEVAYNAPNLKRFGLFDLERIEVLRGPQNTLFGLNTTGGTMQVVTRKPSLDEDMNGYVNVSYGNEERSDIEGATGFRLGDKAAARISLQRLSLGDYIHNFTLNEDQGGWERYAGRAQLLWEPSDDLSILANIHGGEFDGMGTRYKQIPLADPATGTIPCSAFNPGADFSNLVGDWEDHLGNGCADQSGTRDTANLDESISGNLLDIMEIESLGASFRIDYDLGWATLTSLTAYEELDSRRVEDTVGSPNYYFAFHQDADSEQISQEIRLISPDDQRLRWIAGLYYFDEDLAATTGIGVTPGSAGAFVPLGVNPDSDSAPQAYQFSRADLSDEIWAIYGQFDYEVTNKLTATVGFRYMDESKDSIMVAGFIDDTAGTLAASTYLSYENVTALTASAPVIGAGMTVNGTCGNLFAPTTCLSETYTPGDSWTEWGGKLSLNYQVNDDILLYASVSRGFKGGNISISPSELVRGVSDIIVDPETIMAYEGGIKSDWFDTTFQFNASAFYYDWEDQQVFGLLDTGTTGVRSILQNIGQSTMYGAEVDVRWATPVEGLFISAGLGLLDTKIDDIGDALGGVAVGNELGQSPSVSFNGLVRKEWNLENSFVSLQLDFNYHDETFISVSNNPEQFLKDYWLVNARGSYSFGPSQNYEIAVWGKNLTKTERCMDLFSDAFLGFGNIINCAADPSAMGFAWYGVSLSADF